MPKVSVVIPTYNRVKLLDNSISSVLAQTYRDFELLVIDDCSTDNTADFVSSIGDERIKLIRNSSNKGIAGVRNIGVENSSGEYIAFLDDDDEWEPEKLGRQMNLLKTGSANLGCVYTGAFIVDSGGNPIRISVPQYRKRILSEILLRNFIITSSVILRTECFERVGLFDETIPYGEDYDMWIRIAQEFEFDYVKDPLIRYRLHQSSISGNNATIATGLGILLEKHKRAFASNPRAYSNHLLELGVAYCHVGRMKEGKRAFLSAIKSYKFDPRLYYNLAITILGAGVFIKLKQAKDRYLPLGVI